MQRSLPIAVFYLNPGEPRSCGALSILVHCTFYVRLFEKLHYCSTQYVFCINGQLQYSLSCCWASRFCLACFGQWNFVFDDVPFSADVWVRLSYPMILNWFSWYWRNTASSLLHDASTWRIIFLNYNLDVEVLAALLIIVAVIQWFSLVLILVRRLLSTNCLSVYNYFEGLALKGLNMRGWRLKG